MRSPRAALLAAAIVAGLTALACSDAPDPTSVVAASPPGPKPIDPKPIDTVPHGQVAFVGADHRIHLMNVDGTGDTPLSASGGSAPAWSTDGTKLAFAGDSGVYLMNADGSGAVQLIAGGGEPTWSPDGQRIAFVMTQPDASANGAGIGRIAVVNIDGSGFAWLSAGPMDFSPAWSPDGRTIAFVRAENDEITPSLIYEMLVDQPQSARMVTFLPSGLECASSSPAWSPDGASLLLFSICAEGGPNFGIDGAGFAIGNGDGSGTMRPILSNVSETYFSHPAWSPNGQWIVFSSPGYGEPEATNTLYVMRADGSKATQIGLGTEPVWRPEAHATLARRRP